MKKNTVLFVYHGLHVGGVEKELLAYIRHLDAKKFSVHLALTHVTGELLSELPPYVHIHRVIGDSFKPNIRYLVNLYRVISRIRPSVVVGFMQDICFSILLIHKISPVRFQVIVSEHIVLSRWQQVLRTNWVKARLVPVLYKDAIIIAAHGESVLNDLKMSFRVDVSKVRLIPSYIESCRYPFIKKNTDVLGHTQPVFLYMGRLAPEKNIDLLLVAFQTALKKEPDMRLVLVGIGPTKPYRQIIQTLGIKKSVEISRPTQTPETFYRSARALIIPSLVEGRSRVMIEAMLSGCPVISSDFVGYDRYICRNRTGLVFNGRSPNDLSSLILFAAQHPTRMNTIVRNAHAYIKKYYSSSFEKRYIYLINCMFTDALEEKVGQG
jgi:glycosyltransferase involved in cell wall biosynthesis